MSKLEWQLWRERETNLGLSYGIVGDAHKWLVYIAEVRNTTYQEYAVNDLPKTPELPENSYHE